MFTCDPPCCSTLQIGSLCVTLVAVGYNIGRYLITMDAIDYRKHKCGSLPFSILYLLVVVNLSSQLLLYIQQVAIKGDVSWLFALAAWGFDLVLCIVVCFCIHLVYFCIARGQHVQQRLVKEERRIAKLGPSADSSYMGAGSKTSAMEFTRQVGKDGVVRANKGPFRRPATVEGLLTNTMKDAFLTFFCREVQFPWATILVTSPGHSLGWVCEGNGEAGVSGGAVCRGVVCGEVDVGLHVGEKVLGFTGGIFCGSFQWGLQVVCVAVACGDLRNLALVCWWWL